DAAAAAHAVGLATVVARGRRVGQGLGTLAAIRLAHLVDRLALGTVDLARDLPLLQVRLDLAGGEVALVGVLGQVDLDALIEPALLRRIRTGRLGELRFDLASRVEALRGLAGRQVKEGTGQGEQVAARLRLADNLLGRGVPFRVDTRLGRQFLLGRAAEIAGG